MGRTRRLVVIGIWKPDRICVPRAIFERAPRRGICNTVAGVPSACVPDLTR